MICYLSMPELPEVEIYRKSIVKRLKGQTLKRVEVIDGYVIKLPDVAFQKFLKGKILKDIHRTGKYLFWEFEDKSAMMMHFGLSGKPGFCDKKSSCPGSSRVLFFFEEEIFAFVDPRKFGKLDVNESLDVLITSNSPGPDALKVTKKNFINSLKGRNTPVKSALLDQKHFSGIGNWLADEILFQAKIFPGKRLNDISDKDIEVMYNEMKKILKKAIELDADWDRFPDWFFVKQRKKSGVCPRHKTPLKVDTIGGRTTYYCRKCQET